MPNICLAYKSFGINELLIHYMARTLGLYEEHDLNVSLLDATFLQPEDLPPVHVKTALGSVLPYWLRGADCRVVFCSTDRPLFWLYGREPIQGPESLEGTTVALYPDGTPPTVFMNIVLRQSNLDPHNAIRRIPCASDASRLALLRGGDADFAMLGAQFPPTMVEAMGFVPAMAAPDYIRLPANGLAVDAALIEQEPELVSKTVQCFRAGLKAVHEQNDVLARVLRDEFFVDARHIAELSATIRQHFTADGKSSGHIERTAINLMRWYLSGDCRTSEQLEPYLYEYRLGFEDEPAN